VTIDTDVLVIGAGAAGLMCAIETARRGRRTIILEHATKPAEKIRISGGGRCNFTNLDCRPDRFISDNPDFCVSALSRYTQHDFTARLTAAGIPFHEKTLGQLFCDRSARDIIDLLLRDLSEAGGELRLGVATGQVSADGDAFRVEAGGAAFIARSVVVATGGLSIPKIGASGYAFETARRFGLNVIEPRPGLVPFTFASPELDMLAALSGLSTRARASCGRARFEEGLLFTHRGLSGPCVLQVSSYWRPGETVAFDLTPQTSLSDWLKTARREHPKQTLVTAMSGLLPKRLVMALTPAELSETRLADLSDARIRTIAGAFSDWRLRPSGTEGWRTAEVTIGGVDTRGLSSRTLEARTRPGLFFVGECVDVTGWLGGYNFQWAWSSGWAAGQVA